MKKLELNYPYIPLPHWYYEWMVKSKLSGADYVVAMYIMRFTIGWKADARSRRQQIELETPQVEKATDLDKRTVFRAFNNLVESGLIARELTKSNRNLITVLVPEDASDEVAPAVAESRSVRAPVQTTALAEKLEPEVEPEPFPLAVETIDPEWQPAYEALAKLGLTEKGSHPLIKTAQANGRDSSYVVSLVEYAMADPTVRNRPAWVTHLIKGNELPVPRLPELSRQQSANIDGWTRLMERYRGSAQEPAPKPKPVNDADINWRGITMFFWNRDLDPIGFNTIGSALEADLKLPPDGREDALDQDLLVTSLSPFMPGLTRVIVRYVEDA